MNSGAGIPFNSRLIGNFCFPIFTFRKFHNDHSLSSAVAHSANPILPPFNYPPESKSHSSLFAHSFEWRDSFCAATRYARGWREKGGAKRPSSKRKRISVRVSPILLLLVLVKSVVVHARVKREKRGGKPEGRRRDVYIYRERNKERKIRKDGLFDSFHSPSYISSYIYDRGKSCFRRDSNTEEESTMGGATRGKDKSKTCATLMNYVDPVPS